MKKLFEWIALLRSAILFFLLALNTLFFGSLALIGSIFGRSPRLERFVQKGWSWILLKIFCVRVFVRDGEKALSGGAIFLFTHKSHFDVPACMQVLPGNVRFGAKAELFKIPVFGPAMNALGVLQIHRTERERVFQLYADSIGRLQKGESFILAPEGTRQVQTELGPFKAGPFVFAISAQVPVVPVLIFGSEHVLPTQKYIVNRGRWFGDVHVRVLQPIPTAGVSLDDRVDFQNRVREIMVQAYSEGPGDLNQYRRLT